MKTKQKVFVVGGGPAGLMAAWTLAPDFEVHLFEKEKMPGQKLLVAGKGGLNITKNLPATEMCRFYSPKEFMDDAIHEFDVAAMRSWLLSMGIGTYTGSSGKVFPLKDISPAEVLKTITQKVIDRGVSIHVKHRLEAFSNEMNFTFLTPLGNETMKCDFALLALGGASWPQTGSDGAWLKLFGDAGIQTIPFKPSNCGIEIEWPESFVMHHEGKPLKNVEISVGNLVSRGEALITSNGIEGSAIYHVVPVIRDLISAGETPLLQIDFKPFNSLESLLEKVKNIKASSKNYAASLNLNTLQMALIKASSDKDTFSDPKQFAMKVKSAKVEVRSLRPVEEAISTVGGIDLKEVNSDFSLKKFPGIFVAGEMLDWDAPTGGFLLHGSFAGGHYAALGIMKKARNQEQAFL